MKRRLLNIFSAVSLVMCVATAILCGRPRQLDSFYMQTGSGQYYFLDFGPQMILLKWSEPNRTGGGRWTVAHKSYATGGVWPTPRSLWNRLGFWSGYTGATILPGGQYVSFDEAMLCSWTACAIFAVLPLIWVWHLLYLVRNRKNGLCGVCGYDLRATPDRCPECGRVPAGKK